MQHTALYDPRDEHDACGIGFLVQRFGTRSHGILERAVEALRNLAHRGATDADDVTGDGAGILTEIPFRLFDRFLQAKLGYTVPEGQLGVGAVFLSRSNRRDRDRGEEVLVEALEREGLEVLCWRSVPFNASHLGTTARDNRPWFGQVFIRRPPSMDREAFERAMLLGRKAAEHVAARERLDTFSVCSLSSWTIVYKGMLSPGYIERYFADLAADEYETAYVIFHQRYSTNTFPQWHLAQPFRMLAHNGEINTIRGNRRAMRAREMSDEPGLWGDRFRDLRPLVQEQMSDSASLDNALELLTRSGYTAIEAARMVMPPAWENDESRDEQVRAYYASNACILEPWDGPAAIAFTCGRYVAAALDRNGLRPARYKVYDDGTVLLASEVGIIDESGLKVERSGRLGPGSMFAVDLEGGRILDDHVITEEVCRAKDVRSWCDNHLVPSDDRSGDRMGLLKTSGAWRAHQIAFGYTRDEIDIVLDVMATTGKEPVGSMGDDTPHAFLSRRPRLFYSYFKQLFAQVTNPPIDSIRERSVMTLRTVLGGRPGLFGDRSRPVKFAVFSSPILSTAEFDGLANNEALRGRVVRLDATFPRAAVPPREGEPGRLEEALEALAESARRAVESDGARLIVLSDENMNADRVAIPMMLATGRVRVDLVARGLGTACDLVCHTGEARDVHQIACLLGEGAGAIYPYLAYATIAASRPSEECAAAVANYRLALEAGLLKVMARMGVSTLSSYSSAGLFEALGVSRRVVDECFPGIRSRIDGIGYGLIECESLARHETAFGGGRNEGNELEDFGFYKISRKGGEFRGWNGKVVSGMRRFVKTRKDGTYESFRDLSEQHQPAAIRDMFEIRYADEPLPVEEVASVEEIRSRFTTAGMSLGALSPEAHETLAIAMNRIGGKSNSGEGGEDPLRYMDRLAHGQNANSAIKQVASGRFGVTPGYLASAREIEIKIAQGAKPGEGGQLPGHKVTPLIARLRCSVPGVTLISPPPHHDIYSIEDLAQLVLDLREVNPRARICVKLVAAAGVGTIAAGVAKAHADVILISGHEGGTGASPLSSIRYVGAPWEIGLAEAHQVLSLNGLRERVTLRTDGGLKTGRDLVVAAILGAEEFNFGTAAMIAATCAMFRVCHLNTCPVGVATQDEELRAHYKGTPDDVIAYFDAVAEDVRAHLARLRVRSLEELIGRTDLLAQLSDPENLKSGAVDLSALLHDPLFGDRLRPRKQPSLRRPISANRVDSAVLEVAGALLNGSSDGVVGLEFVVDNRDRCIGTRLSGEVAHRRGLDDLDRAAITLRLQGAAGQSLGAFLAPGILLDVTGEANDYVGKGMAGGDIVIRPGDGAGFDCDAWSDNVIAGNTCLYGATGGRLFAAGSVGERFAVRNSGAEAVVEGVGEHACEYMTGGVIVVLGCVGGNFGAGMSGGVAFVLDPGSALERQCNPTMVEVRSVGGDADHLRSLVAEHLERTGSFVARSLLADWERALTLFRSVSPRPQTRPVHEFATSAPVMRQNGGS